SKYEDLKLKYSTTIIHFYNQLTNFKISIRAEVDHLEQILADDLPSAYERATIVAKFFNKLITTLLNTLINPKRPTIEVLGRIKGYVGTVKGQGRGLLHLHMLIWLAQKYTPANLKRKIQDIAFRQSLLDYLADIIKEDLGEFSALNYDDMLDYDYY
ncbi:unnamed protein product, partial [Didymodactylos carnosus]